MIRRSEAHACAPLAGMAADPCQQVLLGLRALAEVPAVDPHQLAFWQMLHQPLTMVRGHTAVLAVSITRVGAATSPMLNPQGRSRARQSSM
jgi:hypothetical protein